MPLVPGPDMATALQSWRWFDHPLEFMEDCAARYGEIFRIKMPLFGDIHIISSPDAVKEIFALTAEGALAGKSNAVLKPLLGEHSLLMLDGAEHMRQRRMMMPAFHGERMMGYGRQMLDVTDDELDTAPLGRAFAVHDITQRVTLKVIVQTVFGVTQAARCEELTSLLAQTLDVAAWPPLLLPTFQRDLGPLSPWGKFVRLRARVRALVLDEITRARRDGTEGRTDVLAMMLQARDEAGRGLSDEELYQELQTLLVAGHETTATALAWALYAMIPDASLMRRLREELDTSGRDERGALVPEKLAKLELLDGCVREALRLRPVIPLVGRVLQKPMRVLGYELPVGSRVAPSIYLVHRRASLYPQPARFWPERYRTFKPGPSEWFPFGGGIRRCVGAAFATFEMKMVLATMVSRLSLRLRPGKPVRVVRRSITLTPSEGMPIIIDARRPRLASRSQAA